MRNEMAALWNGLTGALGAVGSTVASPFRGVALEDATTGVGEVMRVYMDSSLLNSAAFLVAFSIGLNIEIDFVRTTGDYKTESGKDFLLINPKGNVPALEMKSGNIITELPMILLVLCDQVSGAGGGLSYPGKTWERVYLHEQLCWIESMHYHVRSLYDPKVSSNPTLRDYFLERLANDLLYFEKNVLFTKEKEKALMQQQQANARASGIMGAAGGVIGLGTSAAAGSQPVLEPLPEKKYIQPHLTVADLYFYCVHRATYPFTNQLAATFERCPLIGSYVKRLRILPKVAGAEQLLVSMARDKGFDVPELPNRSPSPSRSAARGGKTASSTQAPMVSF